MILSATGWEDYRLLDSGDGRRLERFGPYVLDRPEPGALWRRQSLAIWAAADARFDDGWVCQSAIPDRWPMIFAPLNLTFYASLTPFRHTGVFPEQSAHWLWLADRARRAPSPPRVLVLFGYTGLTTLALARAGAHVTHVDASRPAMTWARENAAASGLGDHPIRWLIDDVAGFLRRESRRLSRYDGIVMDPPAFGRGPKGEVWRFGDSMPGLIELCRTVLTPDPLFLALNAYAVVGTPTLVGNLMDELAPAGGVRECGELAITGGGRVLPTGIFSRWAPA